MSIQVMNEVWTSSHTKGTQRLMLVALADHAGDDGTCWPSIVGLANKCNTTERNVQLILRDLEHGGELITDFAAGRGHKNLYRVLPPATAERLIRELSQQLEKVKSGDEKVKVSALLEKVSAPDTSREVAS